MVPLLVKSECSGSGSSKGSKGLIEICARRKRPECQADHSPPSIAKVKNTWSYTFTLPYLFMA
jgi:hypothetical protein